MKSETIYAVIESQTSTATDINTQDAPGGFVAVEKTEARPAGTDANFCRWCDARALCQENKDEWCKNNPCMSYSREDEKSVVFKAKEPKR